MIISRTPFRISFFGGGTDFPEFFRQHGGAVLSTTIDKYCYLSLHRLTPFFPHRFRASYSRTESVMTPADFAHPLIRETLLHLGITDGIEISHVADLPGQTGLGSSSAFTVGLLHALRAFAGEKNSSAALAHDAIHIERTRVGDAGGWQDQYAVAYGGFNLIRFAPDDTVSVTPLACPPDTLLRLNRSLLIFFLGRESPGEPILRTQISRTRLNTPRLLEMLHMVDTASQRLLDGDLESFGRLLHESWQCKRELANGITNSTIDDAYSAALSAGAFGGKLLGAGGRGFLCLMAPPSTHDAIRARLAPLMEVPFRFESEGSRIIFRQHE